MTRPEALALLRTYLQSLPGPLRARLADARVQAVGQSWEIRLRARVGEGEFPAAGLPVRVEMHGGYVLCETNRN